MPSDLAQDFVQLLTLLLPGFLAAWVFYGLTSHPKPSQFERVVQALIFTFVIQILIPAVQWTLEGIGRAASIRPWDQAAEGLTSFFLAIAFGGLLAYCANKDSVHGLLRKAGFTTRTSHPSEWYYVLANHPTFVVLHLHDGRRLYGWPKEWPIESNTGQFYLMMPSWIDEDGSQIELPELEGILIGASDVRWVEFLHPREDSDESPTTQATNPEGFESSSAPNQQLEPAS